MENVHSIAYINLAHRTDRNEHLLKQLEWLGVKNDERVHRIDAVKCERNGAKGCAQSHCNVLEMAIRGNWKNVMILEDDFTWKTEGDVTPENVNAWLKKFFDAREDDWDVLMLAGAYISGTPTAIPRVARITCAQTTSGFIVNRRAYPKLLRVFRNCVARSPDIWEPPLKPNPNAIDQAWKQLQPSNQWFGFHPTVGTQYESYSDIEKRTHFYGV